MTERRQPRQPLLQLEEDDLAFITRFVLASGSLKDMADAYGVSYPTIRTRLDRVIARLQVVFAGRTPDPMADLLADLVEAGELVPRSAKRILRLHRSTIEPSVEE